MATNTFLTPGVIAKEVLMRLENNLIAANLVHRELQAEFRGKIGDTVTIRKPVRYVVRDGWVATPQDTNEGSTTFTIDKVKGVDMEFSAKDLTLTIDKFSERYIQPATNRLADQIDVDVLSCAKQFANWVGTPGSRIDSAADFFKAPERLDMMSVPSDMRRAVLGSQDHWAMASSLTNLYISDTARTALQKAALPRLGDVELYKSQNVLTFTTGARGGAPLVNGAGQVSTYNAVKATNQQTLILDGATASVTRWAADGDVFTIDGVYDVNPVNANPLPYLKQFRVVGDTNSAGGGAVTLTISPAIIVTGAYQNVSTAPADNAALTFMGAANTLYPLNMAFHRDAIGLVTVPIDIPEMQKGATRVSDNGISINLTPYFDGTNFVSKYRLDIMYGVKAIYPELGTRISGTP